MECKQIDLGKAFCSESALDGVSKLVAKGFNIKKACEIVAEQYAENYPDEAPKSPKQLRKKFYDAQQTTNKKCSTPALSTVGKSIVPIDVPMVNSTTIDTTIDTTKYITIEEHNRIIFEYEKASFEDAERFTKIISELEKQLQSKHISKEEANVLIMDQPPEESTLINRSTVFNFIKKHGNEFQCMALKDDNLPNEKLFKVFVKVREQYKTSTPPPAWDKEIINATEIL